MFLGNNGSDVYIALDRKSTIEGHPADAPSWMEASISEPQAN